MQDIQKLKELAQEICVREGCKLYDIEFQPGSKGQGRRLLVYVDKVPGGVNLDDCEKVSRGMSTILDADADIIAGEEYVLEVSSPGLEKPLKEKWHFEGVIGSKVFVHSNESLVPDAEVKRFKVTGTLMNVEGESVVVKTEDNLEFAIPVVDIRRAHVIYEFDNGKNKKKS